MRDNLTAADPEALVIMIDLESRRVTCGISKTVLFSISRNVARGAVFLYLVAIAFSGVPGRDCVLVLDESVPNVKEMVSSDHGITSRSLLHLRAGSR